MSKHNSLGRILMYHAVLKKRTAHSSTYYHAIYQQALERQLRYCKRNFNIIHPEEYIHRIEKKQKLPPKTLLITFDDGYQNIFDYAFPILKNLQIPFLVFFNTRNINGKWLWFSRLKAYQQRTNENWNLLCESFEGQSIKDIEKQLEILNTPTFEQATANEMEQFNGANIETIQSSLNSGLLVIGGHTADHVKLTSESTEVAVDQIKENKLFLEKQFNVKVHSFAYPEGLLSTPLAYQLKELGFKVAFAVDDPGSTFPEELYQFHLPRIGIFRDNFWYFLAKINHLDRLVKTIVQ